jgi:hypothetical protein
MTEPSPSGPVPGPPRPVPRPDDAAAAPESTAPARDDLAERPVAEHVAVFEAEHARLERELGTIDRL